jgi:lipopolysaccharide biosynthesis glycosyltransferase
MLESLRQHLRPDFHPILYLLHTGLPQPVLDSISSLVDTYSIIPSDAQLAAAPHDSHFPREASFPLLLPEVLPHALERVLFLDADLLVLDDLAKLWERPLDDHVVAASPDAAVPRCSAPRGVKGWKARGIPQTAPYFNCGVLLIDLPRWRERGVTQLVHRYFDGNREPTDFLHQEALNAVLWDDRMPLDPRWNLSASSAGRPYEYPASEAWLRPGIVHFSGRTKPWRAPVGGPFNAPYRKVLERMLPRFAAEPTTLRENVQSLYDRYLRAAFYPLEQYLWRQRLI